MANGVVCAVCGIEAPSKYVEFYYNIGALVVRYHRTIKGNLCKRCIHKYFWKFTLLDIVLGPWGVHSLIVAPIYLINNVARYLPALALPAPPPDATAPVLTDEATVKLRPFVEELVARVGKKEPVTDVVQSVARTAGVTPGQALLFLRAIIRQRGNVAGQPAAPAPKPLAATPVAPPAQRAPALAPSPAVRSVLQAAPPPPPAPAPQEWGIT